MNSRPKQECPECGSLRYRSGNYKCPDCGCDIGIGKLEDIGHLYIYTERNAHDPQKEIFTAIIRFVSPKIIFLGMSKEAEKDFMRRLKFFIQRTTQLEKEEMAELCASLLYYLIKKKNPRFNLKLNKVMSIFGVLEEEMASNYDLFCEIFREN